MGHEGVRGAKCHGDDSFVAAVGKWIRKDKVVGWVSVYGPRQEGPHRKLWVKLGRLMNLMDGEWCLFGDFNEVRNRDERRNFEFNQRGADSFNNFIREHDLVDIPINGKWFTRVSDDGPKFSKLDRFLVSDGFHGLWNGMDCVTLESKLSDHYLLLLKDSQARDFRPRPFRVLDVWLSDPNINEVVNEAWGKPVVSCRPDCVFRDRLKNVKNELKRWSKPRFGDIDKEITDSREEALKWEKEAEVRELGDGETE